MRKGFPADQPSFTLIELLVVVAIIAVLASLLLPALARARGMAQSTDCLNNQKQLGLAWHMYTDEFDGRMCTPGSGTGAWFIYLWLIHQDVKLYACPADRVPYAQMTSVGASGIWPTRIPGGMPGGIGYLANGGLQYYNMPFRKQERYAYQDRTMVMMDGTNHWYMLTYDPTRFFVYGADGVYSLNSRYLARHQARMNALFLDGHSETMAGKSYPADPTKSTMPTTMEAVNLFWRGTTVGNGPG